MRALARLVTGPVTATVWLIIMVAGTAAAFLTLPSEESDAAPPGGAPAAAESSEVQRLLDEVPGADDTAGLVVVTRDDGAELTEADVAAVADRAAALADLSSVPQAVRPQVSDDGTAALVAVPIADPGGTEAVDDAAAELRSVASDGLPDGLTAQLTGPLGFQADTANAFAGADVRLLLITASVVAVLLIVTYRSPVLWIVPLAVVATADLLARTVVGAVAATTDLSLDASVLGIMSVLVFGAGTNYALLLIARYREELQRVPERREAMRRAVVGAGPAIVASAVTVLLSLLLLLFAQVESNRALGVACAIGIGVAVVFAVLVLPAALVLFGRGLFWPFVPRHDPARHAEPSRSIWSRVGGAVQRRPAVFALSSLVLVAALGSGLVGAQVGLSQSDRLLGNPESVQAGATLERAFPGSSGQAIVLAPEGAADRAAELAADVPGVDDVRPGDAVGDRAEIAVTLAGEPQSEENLDAVAALRAALADDPATTGALVGGPDATELDAEAAAAADRALLIPLILALVFVILTALLRSLVASVLLIASVVATYVASLGAGSLIFQGLLGFEAFDTSVVLFAFIFLVALGVDYNIFLTTRAREERARLGTRGGMREALTRTGGVITSAGVLLASVFVVLGVLPVVALAQIGVIVCIGVLLDTLVVRTLVVPSLVFLLGDRFWWPTRVAPPAAQEEVTPSPTSRPA